MKLTRRSATHPIKRLPVVLFLYPLLNRSAGRQRKKQITKSKEGRLGRPPRSASALILAIPWGDKCPTRSYSAHVIARPNEHSVECTTAVCSRNSESCITPTSGRCGGGGGVVVVVVVMRHGRCSNVLQELRLQLLAALLLFAGGWILSRRFFFRSFVSLISFVFFFLPQSR